VIELGRGCTRYRPLLIDFVDRGEVRAETSAALAHLDRCSRCLEAVEATMLTITALRRMGDEAADEAPDADAWPRLKVRIQRWPRRPKVMSPIAGIAMSFAIVAVLVLPVPLGGTLIGTVATPVPTAAVGLATRDLRIEAAYIASVRQASLGSTSEPAAGIVAGGSYPRIYPDSDRFVRKEVSPGQPAGRSPEAI
jgi:anti-sigma factor RsiW